MDQIAFCANNPLKRAGPYPLFEKLDLTVDFIEIIVIMLVHNDTVHCL